MDVDLCKKFFGNYVVTWVFSYYVCEFIWHFVEVILFYDFLLDGETEKNGCNQICPLILSRTISILFASAERPFFFLLPFCFFLN